MRAVLVVAVLASACTEHDPEITRVGGAEQDTSSGAMPTQTGSGATELVSYCQAFTVLSSVCQRCHRDPTLNGAPFPLLTYDDLQAPYFDTEFAIWEQARDAVAIDFMPATFIELDPPVEPLTCEEKTTLLGWLEQGAEPLGGTDCSDVDAELLDCPMPGAGGAGP